MDKTIFLIECSAPHWVPVAARLAEKQIDIGCWVAWRHAEHHIREAFPGEVFHDTLYAKMGLNSTGEEERGDSFDAACELVWRTEGQTVYDQMNRFDYSRDMRHIERSLLFYRILIFWRKKLSNLQPDLVVFPAPPHVVYDYVILCLCRVLGIKTLMFEEATIYPPYCLAMDDYVTGSIDLRRAVQLKPAPSERSINLAKKLRGDYLGAKPEREILAHKARDLALRAGVQSIRINRENARLQEQSGSELRLVNQSSVYKEKGKNLRSSFIGKFAGTRYYQQQVWEWFETKKLQRIYNENAATELVGPAIYVPLAGQPERTTNPQADIYTQQLLMVNILAHAVPEGWRIWVKEHPNQFHPQFAANMCRSDEFYLGLKALDNVQIVNESFDPFVLIDQAIAVATTGGTTALEAVARGKPVLLFGYAWFRDCPNIFSVRSAADVQSILRDSGFAREPIVHGDFESFLEAITLGCFRGLADYPPDGYPMSLEENVQYLTAIIQNRIEGRPLLAV